MQIGMKQQVIAGCQSGCNTVPSLPGLPGMQGLQGIQSLQGLSGDIIDDITGEIKDTIGNVGRDGLQSLLPSGQTILPWVVGGLVVLVLYSRLK